MNRTDLQTDGHDDIWLALLGLVGLNTGIYELNELIEDGLERDMSESEGDWGA